MNDDGAPPRTPTDDGLDRRGGLRQADWRFLLPGALVQPFRRLLLLGGSDALAGLLQANAIAEHVCLELPTDGPVDAVIVLGHSAVSLESAARCLAPGGVLYGEVDRRTVSTVTWSPGRVFRTLRRAGLSPTGLYWIRPDLTWRQSYVPLHVAGPLDWYLRLMLSGVSPVESLLASGLRAMARVGPRTFAALSPCFAFTAVAGLPGAGQTGALCRDEASPHLRLPAHQSVVITHNRKEADRVTLLPFAAGGRSPSAVVRLQRRPRDNERTEAEHLTLQRIRASLDADVRQSIPEPLGLAQCGQLTLAFEGSAQGRTMASMTRRRDTPVQARLHELRLAASWLTTFHRQTQLTASTWGDASFEDWMERPLTAYETALGVTPAEQRLFAAARERARRLHGARLPTVWVHGDFSEDNILRAGERLIVIDWELCRPGPPLLDLLFFTTHWSFTARALNREPGRVSGYQQLLDDRQGTDPVIAGVREVLDGYMRALDIDPRFEPLLMVILWAVRALGRFPWRLDWQEDAVARRASRYVGYMGVLADRVEVLFPEAATPQ